jgi:probable phosphoglycerate mutase
MSELLFLIRHGQTEWNEKGLAQGHTDIPLDIEGHRQATALGFRFQPELLDWVISSDLKRSLETARYVGDEIELDPDLRERSFGEWEGRPYTEVRERAGISVGAHHTTPPGGESFAHLWARVGRAAVRLRARHGKGAVVTHGGTCGVLLAHLIHGTMDTALSFRFSNTGVCILERRVEGPYKLLKYNDLSHLEEPVLSGDLEGIHRS